MNNKIGFLSLFVAVLLFIPMGARAADSCKAIATLEFDGGKIEKRQKHSVILSYDKDGQCCLTIGGTQYCYAYKLAFAPNGDFGTSFLISNDYEDMYNRYYYQAVALTGSARADYNAVNSSGGFDGHGNLAATPDGKTFGHGACGLQGSSGCVINNPTN